MVRLHRLVWSVFPLGLVVLLCSSALAAEILTWEDCVRESMRQHPDIIAAKEEVQAAKAKQGIASSQYLPQLSSDLSHSRSKTGSQARTDKYSYGVSGKQLIFDGFKTRAEVKQAEAELNSAESAYQEVWAEVRSRLRSAFVELLRVQELVELTEEIAGRRRQNAELVRLRYEAGREHRGSLLRAEAVFAQADFEIEQAKRTLRVAQRRLIKELGRKGFEPIEAKGSLELQLVKEESFSAEDIATEHPTVRRLEATTRAQEAGVLSSRSSLFPEVSATASLGQTAEDWPPDQEKWTLGMTVSYPLFEGGKRPAELSRAKANLAQARTKERSGRDGVILNLEDVWAEWMNAVGWVEVQRKFLGAARERARITQAQYSAGLISFEDWNTIEDNLVTAKKAFLNAKCNAMVAEANWIRAKGGGLDEE